MDSKVSNNSKNKKVNQPQILIESEEDSDSESSNSYEFALKKSQKPPGNIMVKYKSVGNSRNRLGSEDIALRTIKCSVQDTRAPNNEGSRQNIPRNGDESYASNSVAMFGIGSFEKYENNCLTPFKIETKTASGVINSKSPQKAAQSQNSFHLPQAKNLKPVEEEDKSKSSEKEPFQPFGARSSDFGKEYRQSFKKSRYKMMAADKSANPEEDLTEEKLCEGIIVRNSVYEFAPRGNTILFKEGTKRAPF